MNMSNGIFNMFGLMVEGDFDDLTFQGTRFLSFDRKMPES